MSNAILVIAQVSPITGVVSGLAMPTKVLVYPGSTQGIQALGFQDVVSGNYINVSSPSYSGAQLTLTLVDQNGAIVPEVNVLAMAYVAGSNGNYQGIFGDVSFSPTVGSGYTLILNGRDGNGNTIHLELVAQVVLRQGGGSGGGGLTPSGGGSFGGNLWVKGVTHFGNSSTVPVNPPNPDLGTDSTADGWISLWASESRTGEQYDALEVTYNPIPSGPDENSQYFAVAFYTIVSASNTNHIGVISGGVHQVNSNGSGSVGQQVGAFIGSLALGSGAIDLHEGVEATVVNQGTGVITNQDGVTIASGILISSTAIIVYNKSLRIASPFTFGLLQHNYGIYIEDQTVGGTNNPDSWAIYVVAGNTNLGPGKVTVGSIVESASLSPTSAATAGVTGQIAWDANNIYICTVGGGAGSATWKKAALTLV